MQEFRGEFKTIGQHVEPAGLALSVAFMPTHQVSLAQHTEDAAGIVARSDLIRALAQKLDDKAAAATVERETLNQALRRRRQETGQ